ncbi:hypothetical protein BBJ28_00018511 [Nothophytophthora sp. Chile5]|nr:hypothetical protein BBJ28_00018511 [Nothophytophthora sp. Chile5]
MEEANGFASPNTTTDEDDSGPRETDRCRPAKKRKATYLVTKEEKEQLNKEVWALEEHLAALKERVGLSGDRSVEKTAKSNVVLGNVLRQQQLLVANAQAGLAACMVRFTSDRGSPSPLYSYIHLGVDDDARRQMLLSIRDFKIQNGLDFVEARSQHLDLLQPYSSVERFVDAQGNFCCTQFDVIQLSGVRSVREVYNAAMFHFMNEEITLSERLGHITVRDFYDGDVEKFSNCRFCSEDENGVKTEMSTANFVQFVEAKESPSGKPFAILLRDNVDVDDLYPYNSSECVRRDQLGAVVLTVAEKMRDTNTADQGLGNETDGGDERELVVIMRRAGYVKIHRPAFPLPELAQQGLIKGMTGWLDVMLATIRSALSSSP